MVYFNHVDDKEQYIDEGMHAAQRAVELDTDDPFARWALGAQHYLRQNYDECAAELEMAIQLDPLNAQPQILVGRTLLDMGRFSEAVDRMKDTVRLFPNEPMTGIIMAANSLWFNN